MNEAQLEKFLDALDDIKNDDKVKPIYDDTLNVYYPKRNELNSSCKDVWDISLFLRLQAAKTVLDVKYEKAKAYLPKPGRDLPVIYFGQMRIGPDFQGSQTDAQTKIVGFPEVVGRPVDVISGAMRNNEIDSACIPVQIFNTDHKWIAANNRGYATHCLAGKAPLRLWPREGTQDELNRLKEVENKGDIPRFTYDTTERLAVSPRTLPSKEIPITSGPSTWVISRVVTVP